MTRPPAILLIEGRPVLQAALIEHLPPDGAATVTACPDLATARAALDAGRFDLLLLPVDEDATPALALLCGLAVPDRRIGVIALLAATAESAMETVLAAGADDVLIRPFRLGTLLARVRRLLAERPEADEDMRRIGPFQFLPNQRLLRDASDDRRIRLTEKEAAILSYLLAAGAPVERQVLLHQVWGYNDQVTTHTLETHIYKLRQKIEPIPSEARLLLTEAGGYRLDPNGG